MRVLIVDDSKINQVVARDTLVKNKIDCDIELASDGTEALDYISKHVCDLVLLDIIMPNCTGLAVLETLRTMNLARVPKVVMLTTIEDTNTLKQCFDLGAVDYIHKPFNELEFISRVKSVIRDIENEDMLRSSAEELEQKNLELIKSNQALQEAQYYLVQKEKMVAIGELAAGIAHEINNPLAFVISNLSTAKSYILDIREFIEMGKDLSEVRDKDFVFNKLEEMSKVWKAKDLDFVFDDFGEVVKDSEVGLSRVAKIVMTMRNFARISDNDVFEYEDINELLEDAILIVNNEIKYSSTVIRHYSDCKLVYCNKGQIEQVIVNMLVNASHAIKGRNLDNGGVIELFTKCDGEFGYISIKDNGTGIPQEEVNKIFNPFFTTKPVGQGTGLGLSISHDIIVNKHNGEIQVESEVGKGTTFTVKIPMKAPLVQE